jgi:hypothetical protein
VSGDSPLQQTSDLTPAPGGSRPWKRLGNDYYYYYYY